MCLCLRSLAVNLYFHFTIQCDDGARQLAAAGSGDQLSFRKVAFDDIISTYAWLDVPGTIITTTSLVELAKQIIGSTKANSHIRTPDTYKD